MQQLRLILLYVQYGKIMCHMPSHTQKKRRQLLCCRVRYVS